MTPDKFIGLVNQECVDQSVKSHMEILATTNPNRKIADANWARIIPAYSKMNEEQKEALHAIIKIVALNTTALSLSLLDGTSAVYGLDDDFVLTQKKDPQVINDSLVDRFWAHHAG